VIVRRTNVLMRDPLRGNAVLAASEKQAMQGRRERR
jgi:hypothetical protein